MFSRGVKKEKETVPKARISPEKTLSAFTAGDILWRREGEKSVCDDCLTRACAKNGHLQKATLS